VPSTVTFRNLLAALSPDDAVKRWMRRHGDERAAMDGKEMHGHRSRPRMDAA